MSVGGPSTASGRLAHLLILAAAGLALAGCAASTTKYADAPTRRTAEMRTTSVAHARPRHLRTVRTARTPRSTPSRLEGYASFYGEGSHVATGARYNPEGLTAAHRTLPFGTKVRVRDLHSGRSVVVTINDRGPFVRGRVLDLSVGAARALGMQNRGVSRIQAEVM
jgi:rare lipoprotein A